MLLFITAIHVGTYLAHDRITDVNWLECSSGQSNQSSTRDMIEWLREGNKAFVADSDGPVPVVVVKANPPYLRTKKNEDLTDNLLALPRF